MCSLNKNEERTMFLVVELTQILFTVKTRYCVTHMKAYTRIAIFQKEITHTVLILSLSHIS